MAKIKWMAELENDQVCLSAGMSCEYEYQLVQEKMRIHFGAWNREGDIVMNQNLTENFIGLPENWKENIVIPDETSYEFYKTETDLFIGPVVALIAFSKETEISGIKLNEHLDYALQFGKGLLFICAADAIDVKNRTIGGYYYSQDGKSKGWKKGFFPYPDAVYNRAKMTKEKFDDLAMVTGNRIFNSFSNGSFNKWELWKRISPIPDLHSHLPETMLLSSLDSLNEMLDRHGSVYLKPAGGTLSKGVMKVSRMKDRTGYHLYYPNRKRYGNGTIQKILVNPLVIDNWVRRMRRRKYIVQEAIEMKMYNQMPIDFRVIMQKNKKSEWECTGIFSKYGKKGSIITNFSRSGFLLSGFESFRRAFKMNEWQAQKKVDELTELSHLICKTFDKYGHYGDVGIDLMVDQSGKVWILEVNTLDTYHRFPLHIDNRELYESVIKKPLEYAKSLTGFTNGEGGKNG